MKKVLLIIICCLLLLTGCKSNSSNDSLNNNEENYFNTNNNDNNGSEERLSDIKVTINDKTYTLKLESNNIVDEFINILPQEFTMSELNGNEKYVYIDKTLTTNSYNPGHIEKGDLMLYGNNCLVIFYKSFDTKYSYTKIGHIDNLADLGSESITAKFEK